MFENFKFALRNRQRKKWEKRRRLGKRSFIVLRGVLRWGGIMFLLTAFTHAITCHGKPDGRLMLSALIACPLAGYLWARCMWYVNERRYGFIAKR